jgi:hypothetical protein
MVMLKPYRTITIISFDSPHLVRNARKPCRLDTVLTPRGLSTQDANKFLDIMLTPCRVDTTMDRHIRVKE